MTNEGKSITELPLPGAMDHGQGRVTFALYAPSKKSVHLIGNFNGWNHQSDPMTDMGYGFWVIEKYLPKGVYFYQFLIDQEVVICDPYAQAVQFSNENDQPLAVIETDYISYEWKHDGWQRPMFRDLIIYEMHIPDFSPEGNFQGVIDRLDYLKELGVNAIELMPVYQSLPSDYWGYTPMFFFAPRSNYGSAHDFRRLVDQAHGHGIAVIIDMVLSHTSQEHPFNKMYPYPQNPWYGRTLGGEENLFGLPSFDYAKDAANGFARDIQIYWLNEFHVDGFRYDYLPAIGQKGTKGLPYLTKTAREVRPEAYLIGEYLPERPDIVNKIGVNGVWHGRFPIAMRVQLSQSEECGFKWTDFEKNMRVLNHNNQDYNHDTFMINYLENHDEMRFINRLRDKKVPEDLLCNHLKLAATILLTSSGEPMLYQGQEWAEDTPLKKVQPNPIHWEKRETEQGRNLCEHYKKMIWLRRAYGCLRTEGLTYDTIDNDRKVVAYHRKHGGQIALIVANFSTDRQTLEIPFPNNGKWYEFFSDKDIEVKNQKLRVDLDAFSAGIFLQG